MDDINSSFPSTFEQIVITLRQLDISAYLDMKALLQLSAVSSDCHKIANDHIFKYCCFMPNLYCNARGVLPSITTYKFRSIAVNSGKTQYHNPAHASASERHACVSSYIESLPPHTTMLVFLYCLSGNLYHLPTQLTHFLGLSAFNFPGCFDHLPPNLTRLHLEEINMDARHCFDNLPSTLTHLTILGFGKNIVSLDHLPPTLTRLCLGDYFNLPVDHLPSKLTHLIFGATFNQQVDYLPLTLKYLCFGAGFNQYIDYLPPKVAYLYLGTSFNKPIDNLPTGLKVLLFSRLRPSTFLQHLDHLPSSLEILRLPLASTAPEAHKQKQPIFGYQKFATVISQLDKGNNYRLVYESKVFATSILYHATPGVSYY